MDIPQIIIADLGREFIKVGYSGEPQPILHIENNIYKIKDDNKSGDNLSSSEIINTDDNETENFVTEIKKYSKFIESTLISLNLEYPHLIVAEDIFTKSERKSFLSDLFEMNLVEAVFFQSPAIFDLFSYSKISGVVVNYGGKTSVSSIFEGVVEKKVELFGGLDLSKELILNDKNGTRLLLEKESLELDERFVVSQVVKYLVEESHHKQSIVNNIFMSGAGAKMKGLEARMKEELRMYRNKILYENRFHTFYGASVFGSIGQARQLFIGAKDYEEFGEEILVRKEMY